jgi:hypothetical protein
MTGTGVLVHFPDMARAGAEKPWLHLALANGRLSRSHAALKAYHAQGGLDRKKAEANLRKVHEDRKHWRSDPI